MILHGEGNSRHEAIQCSLEHADGEAIEHFTPYSKTDSGVLVYGKAFTGDRLREIFGFADLVLTLEGQVAVCSPTLTQLEAAVDSLTPQGGPGFLILQGSAQDYAQAAGGMGGLVRNGASIRAESSGIGLHAWYAMASQQRSRLRRTAAS